MEEKKLTAFLEKIRNINVKSVELPKQETSAESVVNMPGNAVSASSAGTTITLSVGSNLLLGSLVIGSNTAIPDFCVAGFLWGANFAAIGQLNVNGLLAPLGLNQSNVTDCCINLNGGSGHTLYLQGNGNYYKALPVSSGSTRIPIWEIYQATGSFEFMLQSDGQPTSFTADGSTVEITYTGTAKTLTGIVITNPPDKTAYIEGEVFLPAGMIVKAQFSNGSVAVLSSSEYAFSPPNRLNASNTNITVSYTYGQTIKTATQAISVLGLSNVAYGSHSLQKMDIRLPINTSAPVPAVITIHGGNWRTGTNTRIYYDYISNYILAKNAAHINIDYRLMGENGGLPSNSSRAPYKHMLDDIKSALQKLHLDYSTYIDTSKCALAGHSAGGHLALLYAYNSAYNNIQNNDRAYVSLVISEAGPTDLASAFEQSAANPQTQAELASLVGKTINTVTEYELTQASPIAYANASSVNTILAYGTDVYVNGIWTDGAVPVSQAESLRSKINGSDNNTDNCSLYVLYGVDHNSFREVLTNANYSAYSDALSAAIASLSR